MSTGFSFGSNTPTPAFGQTSFGAQPSGSITFGTPVSSAVGNTSFGQPATGFGSTSFSGFGTQPTPSSLGSLIGTTNTLSTFNVNQPTASTGFGFGSNTAPAQAGFGATQPAQSGFGAAQTGFGATQPAQTGFGASQPTQTGFGASQPTQTGFGVAQPATTQTGFGFGNQQPQTTGFGLGLSTPATSSFGFGTTTTSAPLGFGTGTTSSGFGFGASTATSTQPTFNLGLTSAPSSTANLSFGAPTSLGTSLFPTTQTTPSLFNPTTTTAGLSLGSTLPTPSLGLSFGTTSAPTISFGSTQTTTSTGLGTSFNLGTSLGLAGTTTSTLTKPTVTTSQFVGLGGVIQSTPKTGTTTNKSEVIPRNEPLPNEIQQTVESFKNFVKQQKGFSSDVARCSVKEFKKVSDEIEMVSNLLNEVEKQLQSNRAVAEKLKVDTAKGLQCVEMAQRTLETPPGLQYENTAPMEFFVNLVDGFENEMHTLQMQIENTDRYVKNLGKASALNSEDLALGMKRLHESFVALAGRLQSVHSQVQAQKEQYLNLRKYMLHDESNVFEKNTAQSEVLRVSHDVYKPPTVASGPSPFSTLTHPSVVQANINQNQTGLTPQAPQQNLFGQPTTQPVSNLFGNTSLQPTFGSTSSSFQLQKPPTGNKRSK